MTRPIAVFCSTRELLALCLATVCVAHAASPGARPEDLRLDRRHGPSRGEKTSSSSYLSPPPLIEHNNLSIAVVSPYADADSDGRKLHSNDGAVAVCSTSGAGINGLKDNHQVYVYVRTNHGGLTGSCFTADNQGRVDVICTGGTCGGGTVYSKNPPNDPIPAYTGGNTSPCKTLTYGTYTFQFGPIPIKGGGQYQAKVWEFGCMSDRVMSTRNFNVKYSICAAGEYKLGGVCTKCPTGRYRTSQGGNAISDCAQCGAGKYGQSGQTGATVSSHCINCAAGKYSSSFPLLRFR